jgi:DNA-binding NarL/FixJ family response regulator
MKSIRILIADDHPFFRFGLRARLNVEVEMEVVGEAATPDETLGLAAKLEPDVILMDLNFNTPGTTGIDITRGIHEANQRIAVLVLTYVDDDHVFAAMRAGARGYLLKSADPDEVVRAIHAVANGDAIFSPAIAARMQRFFEGFSAAAPEHVLPQLTVREREILALLAQGYRNKQIAECLVLAEKTVRNHVTGILSKLQAANRTEAADRARRLGYI